MMDKSLSPMIIEIEDPEEVTIETEDFALTISEEEPEEDFDSNLAEYMDERELQFLASEIIRDIS